jgi:predicted ArsR family transcriptional regulator
MRSTLAIASAYLPKRTIRKELLHVEQVTNAALDEAIRANVPGSLPKVPAADDRRLEELRDRMAQGHKERIAILVEALGREKAVEVARHALYRAGMQLGTEARMKLGVRDDPRDLEKAARVLYRVLGIEFTMNYSNGRGEMRVQRCALARKYDSSTCAVLCATDEGVVHGLSDMAQLKFTQHLTSGKAECVAEFKFDEEGGK